MRLMPIQDSTSRLRPLKRRRHGLPIPLALPFLLAAGWFFSACEPPNHSDAPADTSSAAVGEASLLLKNLREEDAGMVTFYLYKSDAQAIEDASKVGTLAQLGFGASKTVKVAAGTWKIGYGTESGDLHAMPPAQTPEGLSEIWPQAVFSKGKAYYVTLETDTAALTIWNTNLILRD